MSDVETALRQMVDIRDRGFFERNPERKYYIRTPLEGEAKSSNMGPVPDGMRPWVSVHKSQAFPSDPVFFLRVLVVIRAEIEPKNSEENAQSIYRSARGPDGLARDEEFSQRMGGLSYAFRVVMNDLHGRFVRGEPMD